MQWEGNMSPKPSVLFTHVSAIPAFILCAMVLTSCGASEAKTEKAAAPPPPSIPVAIIAPDTATTQTTYPAAIEGKVNVEIRTQVDGYLDKIFVDEGAFVKKGQPLFKINDRSYREQLNTALANLHAAEANLHTAELEVEKITPLVQHNVVSSMQLKTASSAKNAAAAAVDQAKAAVGSARINVDFTLIKAPVNGYIGRIPKRIGNLITKADTQEMTTLSDISDVYAYFSMSEADFLSFTTRHEGKTLDEKIKKLRPVTLVLANGDAYAHKGKVEVVNGQFDKTTAAITLRAVFPNPERTLRAGNTGKISLEDFYQNVLQVPIAATIDQQDKIFVYVVGDSNKVQRRAISISGKSVNNYIVQQGLNNGDKVVVSGTGSLSDGMMIKPVLQQRVDTARIR